ncbi:nitroreductase/quinone reductase family protein [Isoptericola aurantiacus]|uniref:nitroreductase/quinone reductase family protein n=1 Tax=Isoptericola aurantiacus TaxID=3377839 RepID=UPI00383BEE02
MTFSHSRGTHGARIPGWLFRTVNKFVSGPIKRSSGSFMGMDTLVLTTIGRKSGEPRSAPVAWFDDGDGRWLIVASKGGAASNPAWYLNLAAHPDQVTIERAGTSTPVTATELHGEEREAAWSRIKAEAKQFAGYETKTDRVIPVIRLTARAD